MSYGQLEGTSLERAKSHVLDDGRVNIDFRHIYFPIQEFLETRQAKYAARINAQSIRVKHRVQRHAKRPVRPEGASEAVPRMNIAILITGSRGDVQPFIAFGQVLQKPPYSHRVRICTHQVFQSFVEENGLEFFSIGGDPAKLMAYMVKNPGILPSRESVQAGDIHSRRMDIAEMLEGSWKACTQAGDGVTKIDLESHTQDEDILLSLPPPFVADAIIANPPSYAHIHIAEKLAVPLHIMFTMPWSPTRIFPHPLSTLANVDTSKGDSGLANLFSYKRMDLLTWEGLADLINRFREKTLFLDSITPIWGHEILPRLKVPFTYCWPEVLIPKPNDWGSEISISGYWFLSLASSFQLDPSLSPLQEFLDAGPPPIYVGFGSIVVDDPEALTQLVFDAIKLAGVRALVSKGWGNVGGTNPPDGVFLLGNVPHDWLFPRVSAVVHHGGAGTTAIGIALGKPTVIVPFFGDQPWWAAMVHRAGAGPEAVPFKALTAERLAENITKALEPGMRVRAEELAEKIKGEDGTKKAAEAFHSTPQMQNLACCILPDRVAVWRLRNTDIQLCPLAVVVVVIHGKAKPDHFKLVRSKQWHVADGPQGPTAALIGTFTNTAAGFITDVRHLVKELSSPQPEITAKSPEDGSDESPVSDDVQISIPPPLKRKRAAVINFAGSVLGHTLKAPVALFYNVANGFHNCPATVLSDRTVRTHSPITGFGSGLARSGKEFGFGLYDAVTGLVTQPYYGYKDASDRKQTAAVGIAKGVGRGFGGLFLKTGAAVTGIPGYSFKGLERTIERWVQGSDVYLHGESEIIWIAKDQVRRKIETQDGQRTRVQMMWDDSKGAGMGKRILERRVWQGYRDYSEMKARDDAATIEKEVLERWDELTRSHTVIGAL